MHYKEAQTVLCEFAKFVPSKGNGKILVSKAVNYHNTFDKPDVVSPKGFADFKLLGNSVSVTIPPASVVVIELEGKDK